MIIRMIKDFIFAVFHPSYWMMLNTYDRGFDQLLRELMSHNVFKHTNCSYSVKLGPMILWVANHPYSSFTIYVDGRKANFRASRRTIQAAQIKMLKDIYMEEK